MSDIEKVMTALTALKEEFGVEFQLADPGAPVTLEQRTINNMFLALLEARSALDNVESLSSVLDGYVVGWLGYLVDDDGGGFWHAEVARRISHDFEETAEGTGPTPEAAMRAAVANAKSEDHE